MKKLVFMVVPAIALVSLFSCTSKQEKEENRLKAFLTVYEKNLVPLYKESALASWNANISGTEEDLKKSELVLDACRRSHAERRWVTVGE